MSTFGFETEGREVVRMFADQVKGRTFLITGPSAGGIGAETALSLAEADPRMLILVGRSPEKAQSVIDALHAVNASTEIKFVSVDLSSMASVRKAAKQILEDDQIEHIDVVINNAGIMACPYELTPEGIELQLAANHLGHFLLTNLLMPKILPSTSSSTTTTTGHRADTRVVNVSSVGNKYANVRWDDPNFTADPASYRPFAGYGQSKTANGLFAIGLNARLASPSTRDGGSKFRAYAVQPGSVRTNLQRHMTPALVADAVAGILGEGAALPRPKTTQQGCGTTLRAALDPDLPRQYEGGVWLVDTVPADADRSVVAAWAVDPEGAERCWRLSEELVGQKFEY